MGVHEGNLHAVELGLWHIITETDCLVLKHATTSNAYDLATHGFIFQAFAECVL